MSAVGALDGGETLTLASGRRQVVHRAGSGPTVLWLHGLAGVEPDDRLVAALAERYSVVAPVAPGFADVEELRELWDVHDLALHYDDIVDALGVGEVAVVGLSFGALIAAELAAHVPARVSRLVLLSPLGLWDDMRPVTDIFAVPYPQLGSLLTAAPPPVTDTRAGAPPGAGITPTGAPGAPPAGTDGAERDVEHAVAVAQAMTTVAKFLWPIPDSGLRRRLYRIAAPTLVLFGESDAIVPPSYGADFAAAIPNAISETVPGAGHLIPSDRPDLVIERVTRFLGA